MFHRCFAEKRQVFIDRFNLLSQGGGMAQRRNIRPQIESHRVRGILKDWKIKMWLIGLVEAIGLNVSDNTDDCHPGCLRSCTAAFHSQTDRIAITEVTFRES